MHKYSEGSQDKLLYYFFSLLFWLVGLLVLLSLLVTQGEAAKRYSEALRLSIPKQPVAAPTFRP